MSSNSRASIYGVGVYAVIALTMAFDFGAGVAGEANGRGPSGYPGEIIAATLWPVTIAFALGETLGGRER